MTQMQAHDRFENAALVEAWLKEPTFLEPVDEGHVAAIVHHTPQVRRWPPQVDLGRFAPMFDATKFAAASVILALVGGLLFTTLPSDPNPQPVPAAETATTQATVESTPDPRPTTDADAPFIVLPDELPDGVEGGTIDTPAGPARWVHLTSADASVPHAYLQLLPWGDGIAAWDGYLGELRISDDGVDWKRNDAWPSGRLARAGETYVLVQAEEGRVWTSTDPRTGWDEVDASALEAARPTGWRTGPPSLRAEPMLVDDRIVFTVEYGYSLPKGALGISDDDAKVLRPLPGDRHMLCSGGQRSSCDPDGEWVLRFKETPRGLVVRRASTGERLGLIEGATADQIYKGRRGIDHRVFAIEGGKVVETSSPWPGIPAAMMVNHTVAPGSSEPVNRFLEPNAKEGPSTPGLSDIAAQAARNEYVIVEHFPDRLVAYLNRGLGRFADAWASTDGLEWTPAPSGVPEKTNTRWTGSAWVATRDLAGKGETPTSESWVHVGGEWVSLESMGMGGRFASTGIGNVTLFTASDPRSQELWVLTLPAETE